MSEILSKQIQDDLIAGIQTIRSEEPTDRTVRDRAIAAMLELQLRKAQSFELSRSGIKLNGWLAVVAFAAILGLLAWKIDVPDCIRAWKGQPTEEKAP